MKKFNKNATAEILRLLKTELKEYRIALSDKDELSIVEEKIKATKERITLLGIATKQAKGCEDILTIFKTERERAEQELEYLRGRFKSLSRDAHDAKEMVRHLEHAISTLKKEFAQ